MKHAVKNNDAARIWVCRKAKMAAINWKWIKITYISARKHFRNEIPTSNTHVSGVRQH